MQITPVGATDLPDLLPLVRAYCDFYQVTPTDRELVELSRALLADPEREGLQLLARNDAGRAVGFATLYWSWQTLVAARVGVMTTCSWCRRLAGWGGRGADCCLPGALPRAWRDPAGLADGHR